MLEILPPFASRISGWAGLIATTTWGWISLSFKESIKVNDHTLPKVRTFWTQKWRFGFRWCSFFKGVICRFHLSFGGWYVMINSPGGGWTNPFEKYSSNWIISPGEGEHKKYLKPPPSSLCRPFVSARPIYYVRFHQLFGCSDVARVYPKQWRNHKWPYRLDYPPKGTWLIQAGHIFERVFRKKTPVVWRSTVSDKPPMIKKLTWNWQKKSRCILMSDIFTTNLTNPLRLVFGWVKMLWVLKAVRNYSRENNGWFRCISYWNSPFFRRH